MKKLSLLLLPLVLVGCANQPIPSEVPPPAPVKQESALAPDFTLGGVALGDTQEAVAKALGQPDEKTILQGVGLPLWVYKQRGLQVAFGVAGGKVGGAIYIRGAAGFTTATRRGVKVGDTQTVLLAAYPGMKVDEHGVAELREGDRKLQFQLTDGKVAQILVTQAPL